MEEFIKNKSFGSFASSTTEDDPFAGLTPKERLKRKKELKAKEEADKLKSFTKEAAANY